MRKRQNPSDYFDDSEYISDDESFLSSDIQMPLDEDYDPERVSLYDEPNVYAEHTRDMGMDIDEELDIDTNPDIDEDTEPEMMRQPYYERQYVKRRPAYVDEETIPDVEPVPEDSSAEGDYYEDKDQEDREAQEVPKSRGRKTDRKKPRRVKNRQIMGILYGFLVLFLGLIGYFLYFDVYKADDVLNNPNNVRISRLTENIIRGRIESSDGAILAETLYSSAGEEYRSYPYANMFSHVVGMAKLNRSGIETLGEYYMLQSDINPIQKIVNDIKGDKNPGDDIITTLDCRLQQAAYNALGNQKGVVVAMDPTTGKVLCMLSKPDYDPNTLESIYESVIADDSSKILLNQATSGKFTPGSIFKMVTTLEYMREYPHYNDYTYQCNGSINLVDEGRDVSLSCYAWTVHGFQNLTDSFANSCNSSFANIGLNLNVVKYKELCESLYFNRTLPTDIPTIKSSFSLKATDSQWKIGATAIGQGDTGITPLHALMITSAIANGGVGMKPYLIDYVESRNGDLIEKFSPSSYGNLMSAEEASTLKDMMKAVVNYGTASSLSGYSYQIAGKTGTAEVDNAGNNAWFVGFAPADNPKIAVCVLVEDTDLSGSYIAVPIASTLFETYLGY